MALAVSLPASMYLLLLAPLFAIAAAAAAWSYILRPHVGFPRLRGPEPSSWLLGNEQELSDGDVGTPNFDWSLRYGRVYKVHSSFGRSLMMVTDPASVFHILQNTSIFRKAGTDLVAQRLAAGGPSLASTVHGTHDRLRRILNPAFKAAAARDVVPLIRNRACNLKERWSNLVAESAGGCADVDVLKETSAVMADVLGEFAFGQEFDNVSRLGKAETPYVVAARQFAFTAFLQTTTSQRVACELSGLLPYSWTRAVVALGVVPRVKKALGMSAVNRALAHSVIASNKSDRQGASRADSVISLVLKANDESDPQKRIAESEMESVIAEIIMGSQDTIALTTSWILYELSLHPCVQDRLRSELNQYANEINDPEPERFDVQALPLLSACVKETLRFHPIADHLNRETVQDTILPLASPVLLADGRKTMEVAIPAHSRIRVDIAAYNRDPELWGKDSQSWNPDRWLRPDGPIAQQRGQILPGIYEHLLTFSEGGTSCIGYRVALAQVHMVLAVLVPQFEVRLQPGTTITRKATALMGPVANGDYSTGFSMPIEIRTVS